MEREEERKEKRTERKRKRKRKRRGMMNRREGSMGVGMMEERKKGKWREERASLFEFAREMNSKKWV